MIITGNVFEKLTGVIFFYCLLFLFLNIMDNRPTKWLKTLIVFTITSLIGHSFQVFVEFIIPGSFVFILISFSLQDTPGATRTLDLASTLEVGSGSARPASEADTNNYNLRSVLTIAFQFTFENHTRDNVAAMARQYVRSVVGSVQRVAMAIAPSRLSTQLGPKPLPQSPEALTLAQWICRSYRFDFHTMFKTNKLYFYLSKNKILNTCISYFVSSLFQDTYWRRDFSSGFPVWWCGFKATLAPFGCNHVLLCQNKCIDSLLIFSICRKSQIFNFIYELFCFPFRTIYPLFSIYQTDA